MELNDENAKKAYEAVIKALKDCQLYLEQDDESLKVSLRSFYVGVDFSIDVKLNVEHCLVTFVSYIFDILPSDNLLEVVIALNDVNSRLNNGRFYLLDKHIFFEISTRYNIEDTHLNYLKNINYMFKTTYNTIDDLGKSLISLAKGTLTLPQFLIRHDAE
ncbi:MAG: hypothetical protein IJX49_00435 [Clostridia bacterium]|nr:hypothetical protein [Clostridia bacterium]